MHPDKPSRTALIVAFCRALGDLGLTSVPDFRDPFARRLLSGSIARLLLARFERRARDPGDELVRAMRPHLDGVLLRVAYIDALIAERPAPQVVILGAGLDTRAWRLPVLRGARVFEVDHPATQAYKQKHAAALGPALAELRYVPVDFTQAKLEHALAQAGHEPGVPSLWIWEGVIMYMRDAALRGTLASVRRSSAPGSSLLAHYHEPDPTGAARRVAWQKQWLLRWLREPQLGLRARSTMQRELTHAGFAVHSDAGVVEQAQRVGGNAPEKPESQVSRIALATPV